MNFRGKLLLLYCAGLLSVALASGANARRESVDASEVLYWKRLNEQIAGEKAKLEQQREEHRQEIIASLPELAKAAAAIQPELIAAEDGLEAPLPPTFSLLDQYPQEIGFGLVTVLIGAFAWRVLSRHKREAEIRALTGGYLSDGTEVANYQMPEWFTNSPSEPVHHEKADQATRSELRDRDQMDSIAQFFRQAPHLLEEIGDVLKVCTSNPEPEKLQKLLEQLNTLISNLRTRADNPSLRPAWQISSALELLSSRVAEKPKDATPSVFRTFASSLELLRELCVVGVRPTLITEPPLKIMAVDDDPLCRRAIQFALQKAHFTPDLAEDGEQAVALAGNAAYDVIFMDIQMPGIDGLTACSQIHKIEKNAGAPVIFVTSQSDFNTRAQSRSHGGSDFIAKPYLVFEITVKAVTYAMRKRLQEPATTQAEAPVPNTAILDLQVQASGNVELKDAAGDIATGFGSADTAQDGVSSDQEDEWEGDFFSEAPKSLGVTRKAFQDLRTAPDAPDMPQKIGHLSLRIQMLGAKGRLVGLQLAPQLGSALEALLNKLQRNPKTVTTSTLNTVSNALRLLENLCLPGVEVGLANHPPLRILVVDDEPLARRAVVGALQLAFEKPDNARDGSAAAALVAEKSYDVIFTDVQMPVMDGFELCANIRASTLNCSTPVVFITNFTDLEVQAKALECGGNDFIGKPFLPIEITLKALTFAWEGRLKKITLNEDAGSSSLQRSPVQPSSATPTAAAGIV